MTMKRALLLCVLLAVGCEGAGSTPAPFRPEDRVVPVALDPARPHPPPPSTAMRRHERPVRH
jgi:hypothetical protein